MGDERSRNPRRAWSIGRNPPGFREVPGTIPAKRMMIEDEGLSLEAPCQSGCKKGPRGTSSPVDAPDEPELAPSEAKPRRRTNPMNVVFTGTTDCNAFESHPASRRTNPTGVAPNEPNGFCAERTQGQSRRTNSMDVIFAGIAGCNVFESHPASR